MSFGDILYLFAIFFFALITFIIIRNYFQNKFDSDGHRIDMQDNEEEK